MFRTRAIRTLALVGTGVLAVALAGCGSSSTSPSATAQPTHAELTSAVPSAPAPTIAAGPTGPAPTAAPPSAADTPGSLSANDSRTDLAAGTYLVGPAFAVPFSITIASAWTVWSITKGDVSLAKIVPETPDARPVWLTVDVVENVYADPCKGTPPLKPTVALSVSQIVTALGHMKGFKASRVTDVIVGGYPGKAVELTNAIDSTGDGCTGGGNLSMWTIQGGGSGATNDGGHDQISVVDVRGTAVLIDGTSLPGAPADAAAELDRIVHTIAFR